MAMTLKQIATDAAVAVAKAVEKPLKLKANDPRQQQLMVPFRDGGEAGAIKALVTGIRRRRYRRFGLFHPMWSKPHKTVIVLKRGVCVRAIEAYRISTDECFYRLDVLGARA